MRGHSRRTSPVLRSLGGRTLLFSELGQRVYELDDLTAFVWESLRQGIRVEAMIDELVGSGVDGEAAACAIRSAVAQLQAIQETDAAPKSPETGSSRERIVSFVTEVAGVAVQLHLSEDLLPEIEATLGYLRTCDRTPDSQLFARRVGDQVEFLPPGRPLRQCGPAEFVPILKAELLEQVLQLATYEVALHTAAVVRNRKALLLAGSPGAGKTTLALALTRSGWALAADDVVLLDQDGRITGLPFPLTAKSSSWPLIDEHWPELSAGPVFHRPDGFDVRYIVPEPMAGAGPWEIGSVVLLDRRAEGDALLEEVEPTSAFAALLAEGTSHDQQLSTAGFTALVGALDKAQCRRLIYSDLLEGADVLRDLCP